ncbi:hypothetical protein M8J77_024902 [Diaphorina citri]|nr:hypothetical protein M8J77_024902 [Diaphorina citri]
MHEKYEDHLKIYTDGSKDETGVGCALTIPQLNETKRFALNKHSSVFHAELFSILQSLNHVKELNTRKILIISDSLSSFQAISNLHHPNPLVKKIHEEYSNSQANIKFLWCPSHVGISGNERADVEAKKATSEPISNHSLLLDEMKSIIKKHFYQKWNTVRTSINPNENKLRRIKSSITPWKTSSQKARLDEVCLMRMRIGHTKITHSHLFKREERPECDTCHEPVTVEHLLLHCNKLRFRPPSFLGNSLSNILSDNPDSISTLMRFLKRNNFLKHM